MIKNWKEWFISLKDDTMGDEYASEAQANIESGTGHIDETLKLKKKAPRCAKCKRYMGYDDGMYIMITSDWRVHIRCFNEVLTRHFERGEVIDLATGQIVSKEQEGGSE